MLRLDLRRWQLIDPQALAAPLFAELRAELALEDAPSLRAELAALAPSLRLQTLEHRLAEQIIAVLRLDLDGADLDPRRPFGELGFDSLTALELRNRLEARLELSLPATLIWTYPNLATLGQAVADALDLDFADADAGAKAGLPTPTRPSTALDLDLADAGVLEALLTGLEALSDAELDTILEPSARGDS